MAQTDKMNFPVKPWIDISVPVRTGMVHWPGDIDISVERVASIRDGSAYNLSHIHMSAHTGTHMDAPLHFIDDARPIDDLPFDATVGPARLIEIHDPVAIRREELLQHNIQRGERILFKTWCSARAWKSDKFAEDFVYISEEGALYLAEIGILSVGVDYLSVGGFVHDTADTHVALLGAGIWIMEGLDLSQVSAGRYELICLPLKLVGADGAPARAILREIP
jgi:arylformamidase